MNVEPKLTGAFFTNLNRKNSKIKEDRAIAITETAQLLYKRKVEDMEIKLKQLQRDRTNMLDLSPTTADSLVLASDFNAEGFVEKDIQIGVDIRNLTVALDIARESYKNLFETQNETE